MINKSARWGLVATLLIAAAPGCGENQPARTEHPVSGNPPGLEGNTVGRIYWMGKKRLGIVAGAYFFMRLWELPQAKALEAQTLDKLASAPWRMGSPDAAPTNAPVSALRNLFEDVLQEETYLEIRHPEGQFGSAVFAIRLDDTRAGVWQTNLMEVVQSLTRGSTATGQGRGWSIKLDAAPRLIGLTREGRWTLVSQGQDGASLVNEFVQRIRGGGTPVPAGITNSWIEVEAVPSRAIPAVCPGVNIPGGVERVQLSVTGDGAALDTAGSIKFDHPLNLAVEPWNVPTNLMRGPIASLTACRGFGPVLAAMPGVSNWFTGIGALPNQLFIWTGNRSPLAVCVAAPEPDARGVVERLTDQLVGQGNAWLNAHSGGSFQRLPDGRGVTWAGIPMSAPYITAPENSPGWLFGELIQPENSPTTGGAVPEQVNAILGRTNLVYYNWDYTAPRMSTSLYLAQLVRIVSKHPQLAMETRAEGCVSALASRLDNSETVITMSGPDDLKLARHSTVGLTALELNLLAGWLELPEFPFGWDKLP